MKWQKKIMLPGGAVCFIVEKWRQILEMSVTTGVKHIKKAKG